VAALKELYSHDFFDIFAQALSNEVPGFDKAIFFERIFDNSWENLELKERMRHTTKVLNSFFSGDVFSDIDCIKRLVPQLQKLGVKNGNLEYILLADYIEVFGQEYFEEAFNAFQIVTPFSTCEFAIRPFILKYPDKAIPLMLKWCSHSNEHVRRLASEGCRPRLPWAMALPPLKKNPAPIFPIIQALLFDESEYVRRSVANNLNDISKDHPQLVLEFAQKWIGHSENTDKLIKHACRGLLKSNFPGIMDLFGLGVAEEHVQVEMQLTEPKVTMGGDLYFSVNIKNAASHSLKLRLEYAVYFLRQNGTWSKKVFKISERNALSNETVSLLKKHSFRYITTRKYYSGIHYVSAIVNGIEFHKHEFELI